MKRGKMKPGGPTPKTGKLPRLLKLAAYGTLGLGAAQSQAESTISFEGFTADNINISTIPDYGNNIVADSLDYSVGPGRTRVIGTPNITLDWSNPGWQTYTLWDGRGTVAQTDFNAGPEISLFFTPSAEAAVRIVSFQLDYWHGDPNAPGLLHWSITGPSSGVLATGDWSISAVGGRTLVAPDVSGRPGEALGLSFELGTGSPSYWAIDNLIFDQVPEPSTWAIGALGAAALGAAAMRRRRRA